MLRGMLIACGVYRGCVLARIVEDRGGGREGYIGHACTYTSANSLFEKVTEYCFGRFKGYIGMFLDPGSD